MFKAVLFLTLTLPCVSCLICKANAKNIQTQTAPSLTVVDVLIKYGMNPVHPAINRAMEAKDYDAVNLLIEHGVDLNVRMAKTIVRCHKLKLDSQTERYEDRRYNDGKTILETAIERGEKPLIKRLLSKGADPHKQRNLEYILHNMPDKTLSYVGPFEIETGNRVDYVKMITTSIYDVIKIGDLEVLTIFAEAGVDFNKPCCENMTPIQYAHELKNKEIMQFLLDYGVKI